MYNLVNFDNIFGGLFTVYHFIYNSNFNKIRGKFTYFINPYISSIYFLSLSVQYSISLYSLLILLLFLDICSHFPLVIGWFSCTLIVLIGNHCGFLSNPEEIGAIFVFLQRLNVKIVGWRCGLKCSRFISRILPFSCIGLRYPW